MATALAAEGDWSFGVLAINADGSNRKERLKDLSSGLKYIFTEASKECDVSIVTISEMGCTESINDIIKTAFVDKNDKRTSWEYQFSTEKCNTKCIVTAYNPKVWKRLQCDTTNDRFVATKLKHGSNGKVLLYFSVHLPRMDATKNQGKDLKAQAYTALKDAIDDHREGVDIIMVGGDWNMEPNLIMTEFSTYLSPVSQSTCESVMAEQLENAVRCAESWAEEPRSKRLREDLVGLVEYIASEASSMIKTTDAALVALKAQRIFTEAKQQNLTQRAADLAVYAECVAQSAIAQLERPPPASDIADTFSRMGLHGSTSAQPASTSAQPASTSAQPASTSAQPASTSAQSASTSAQSAMEEIVKEIRECALLFGQHSRQLTQLATTIARFASAMDRLKSRIDQFQLPVAQFASTMAQLLSAVGQFVSAITQLAFVGDGNTGESDEKDAIDNFFFISPIDKATGAARWKVEFAPKRIMDDLQGEYTSHAPIWAVAEISKNQAQAASLSCSEGASRDSRPADSGNAATRWG